uniref:RPW8 domain-containing protein n=1 Tax=Nymphaea colorata TaxID=210225 RepID=A0A5K1CG68_9MAGN
MALVDVAVGVVFQQLWEIVRGLATQPGRFREQYQRLQQDLACLEPILARVPPAELNDVLRRGRELTEKCGKVSRWNFLKQKKYSKRLKKLDEEIDRFVRMHTLKKLEELTSKKSGIRRFFRCFACSSPSDPAERDRGEHS